MVVNKIDRGLRVKFFMKGVYRCTLVQVKKRLIMDFLIFVIDNLDISGPLYLMDH